MTWPRRPFARKRKSPEHDLQKQVVRYFNFALGPEVFWTCIDHAGGGKLLGALRKARGIKAGIADILLIYDGQAYFIELKSAKGRLSDEQLAICLATSKAGAWTLEARSVEDVQSILDKWGFPLRARIATEPRAVQGARSTA